MPVDIVPYAAVTRHAQLIEAFHVEGSARHSKSNWSKVILALHVVLLSMSCLACTDREELVAGLPCPSQGVADFSGRPGFPTAIEALTWALETQPPLVTGPGDEDKYTQVRRSEEWIDFEYQVNGEVHHTWEVVLQGGQWGIGARSGCQPSM